MATDYSWQPPPHWFPDATAEVPADWQTDPVPPAEVPTAELLGLDPVVEEQPLVGALEGRYAEPRGDEPLHPAMAGDAEFTFLEDDHGELPYAQPADAPAPGGLPVYGPPAPEPAPITEAPQFLMPYAAREGKPLTDMPAQDLSDEGLMRQQMASYEKKVQAAAEGQKNLLAKRRAAIEQRASDEAEARTKARERRDQYAAKIKEMATMESDPGRWMASRSTGQQIAALLSVGIGGLLAPNYGGRNSALELIERQIKQDIDAQKEGIANRKWAMGQEASLYEQMLADDMDEIAAEAKTEAALWEVAQQRLMHDVAGMDREGDAARRAEFMSRDMEAKKQAAYDKYEWRIREWGLKVREDARNERELRLKEQKQRTEVEAMRAKARPATATKPDAASLLGDLAADLGITDANDRKRIVVLNPSAKNPTDRGFLAVSHEHANRLGAKIPVANQFIAVGSRLVRSIRKHGWEPTGRAKSIAGGQMMADYGDLTLLTARARELGAISESDRDLIINVLGNDPTKWKASDGDLAQLERTIENVVSMQREELKSAGHTGTWKPPYSTAVEDTTTSSTKDQVLKLEAARTPDERATASRELYRDLNDPRLYSAGGRKDDAERAIKHYSTLPRKERMVPIAVDRGGRKELVQVDMLDELRKFVQIGSPKDEREKEQAEKRERAKGAALESWKYNP